MNRPALETSSSPKHLVLRPSSEVWHPNQHDLCRSIEITCGLGLLAGAVNVRKSCRVKTVLTRTCTHSLSLSLSLSLCVSVSEFTAGFEAMFLSRRVEEAQVFRTSVLCGCVAA